jgi:hypothetical protein
MSAYPSAVYNPRVMVNRPGVVYDEEKTKVIYAEDFNKDRDEIVAIENALGANFGNLGLNGWLAIAIIPTLQSSDAPNYVLRFNADMTALLAVGQKIKLTQHGAVKYFFIMAVSSFFGGNTDVTVYGGTDYVIENTGTYPVTVPYFSTHQAPFGFPLDESKWIITYSSDVSKDVSSPNASYKQFGDINITLPIGLWKVKLKAVLNIEKSPTFYTGAYLSFSTSTSSVSNADFTTFQYFDFGGGNGNRAMYTPFNSEYLISCAVKTVYYPIGRGYDTNISVLKFRGDFGRTLIKAVPAYL